MFDTQLNLNPAETDALLLGWGVVTSLLMSEEGEEIGMMLIDRLDADKHYPALTSLTEKLTKVQHAKTVELLGQLRETFSGGPVQAQQNT